MTNIKWLDDVAEKDYTAAYDYLSLRYKYSVASTMVEELKAPHAEVCTWRANDILRACRLKPLSRHDPGVKKDLYKISTGQKLSPVLLISFSVGADIADGYHRVSAVYHVDPFALIPARITHQ